MLKNNLTIGGVKMDVNEVKLAEKIKFWEEQEEINKILVSRIIELESQSVYVSRDKSISTKATKALKYSLWAIGTSFIALISSLIVWVI